MDNSATEIYRSPSGDRWKLVRYTGSGHIFVRHEPNPSSGGLKTDMDVDNFSSVNGSRPEYAALRRILARPATTDELTKE